MLSSSDISTNSSCDQRYNSLDHNNNFKFQKSFKIQHATTTTTTPSTISTAAASSLSSNYSSINDERISTMKTTDFNQRESVANSVSTTCSATKEIIERWKREKLEQKPSSQESTSIDKLQHSHQPQQQQQIRPKMQDITNVENKLQKHNNVRMQTQTKPSQVFKKNHHQQLNCSNASHFETMNDSFIKQQLEVTHEDEEKEDGEDNATQTTRELASSSVMTTPTTNTALNPIGLDRLFNRNKLQQSHHPNKDNNSTTVAQLFTNSQSQIIKRETVSSLPTNTKEKDSIVFSSSHSPDVSFITQDTDLMFHYLQDCENIDEMLEQVGENDKMKKMKQIDNNGHYDGSSFTLSSSHRPSTIKKMMKSIDSNYSNIDNQSNIVNALKAKLEKSRVTMLEQEDKIISQSEEISNIKTDYESLQKEFDEYKSMMTGNISKLMNQVRLLPSNLDLNEIDDDNVLKAEPKSVEDLANMIKRLCGEQIPQLNNTLLSKKEELEVIDSTLNDKKKELEQTLSKLQTSQEEKQNQQFILTNLGTSIASKQAELSEVQALCDERVKSVHDMEQKANLSVKKAQKRNTELKLMEREFRLEKEEFENDRIAWEEQIHLRHDEMERKTLKVEEDRKEIILLSESLDSNRQELKSQREELKSIQEEVLEMEKKHHEKQNELINKESELEKTIYDVQEQLLDIRNSKTEVTQSLLSLSKDKDAFERQRTEFLNKVDEFEREKKDFDLERDHFMDRVYAFEEKEVELKDAKKGLDTKLSKFKETVKQAKDDSARKRMEFNKLDEEMKKKEYAINQRMQCCVEEESRIAQIVEELMLQKKAIEEDRMDLDHSIAEWNKKDRSLNDVLKKCEIAETKLHSIINEESRVSEALAKKLSTAQADLESLRKKFNSNQNELNSCLEQVSAFIS